MSMTLFRVSRLELVERINTMIQIHNDRPVSWVVGQGKKKKTKKKKQRLCPCWEELYAKFEMTVGYIVNQKWSCMLG